MDESFATAGFEDEITYCARHPERETGLRCNRCERYMCVDCAQRTPVGYTCRECVRGHEDRFYQSTALDYALVAAVSAAGGALIPLASIWVGGFVIVGFFLAPAIGGAAAQLALGLTGRRRGRQSGYISAGALLLGGAVTAILLTGGLGLFPLLFLALASSAAYTRFKLSI